MKFVILLFLVIVSSSCERHHKQEFVVEELIKGHDNLSEVMMDYESSLFYKDSILKNTNPDELWSDHFAKFNNNYHFENNGFWFDKRYYQNYFDLDNAEISIISIVSSSNPSDILEFHFRHQNDKWLLIGINYRPNH